MASRPPGHFCTKEQPPWLSCTDIKTAQTRCHNAAPAAVVVAATQVTVTARFFQELADSGCQRVCHRIALSDKGKPPIRAVFGSHRKMRQVCPYQAASEPPNGDGAQASVLNRRRDPSLAAAGVTTEQAPRHLQNKQPAAGYLAPQLWTS
jgi:hypothetical protein